MTGSDWSEQAPFYATLGLHATVESGGGATMTLPVAKAVSNRKGNVHGGAIASLLDISMSAAVRASVDDLRGLSTISLSVSYVSGGSGDLMAEATVVRSGRSTAFASADVTDAAGKVVATGQAVFRIIR